MTGNRRIAAYLGGGCLLAAWLASAASTSRQAAVEPPPPSVPATSNTEALAAGVQAQAARLRQRIAGAPAPAAPARNPFVFAARELVPAPRLAPRRIEPGPATDAPVPAEPQFELVGVAEEQSANGIVRTAMITGDGDELFMLTEGQVLAGRYRVTVVGSDVVQLESLTTGAIRRLALR